MFSVYYSIIEYLLIIYKDNIIRYFGNGFLIYLRCFRIFLVLRILKLCRKIKYMKFIFRVLKDSFKNFMILICLFLLLISFYALIGRHVFNDSFLKKNENNRQFSSFSKSCVTVFNIITLDNWYSIIIMGNDNLLYLNVYVISLIFIGNFIFLNLFLTVLLDSFQNETLRINNKNHENKKMKQEQDQAEEKINFLASINFTLQNFELNKKLTIFLTRLFKNSWINKIFYSSILLNIILMTILTLIKDSNSSFFQSLTSIKYLLYSIYTIEGIIYTKNEGFMFSKNAYLKNPSNIITF